MEEVIQPQPQMGLSFEQVWAALMETRQRQEETARQMQETDRQMQETRQLIKEAQEKAAQAIKEAQEKAAQAQQEAAQAQEKAAQAQEKAAVAIQANADQMKKLGLEVGNLGNRFGEVAEHLIIPNIKEKFNALGYEFTVANTNTQLSNPKTKKVEAEVDILLENGKYIIGVEVKAKPVVEDVYKHVKRLEIIRKHKPNEEVRGAIAGAIMLKDVREAALAEGMYVIEQSGDTVKIVPPEIHSQWEQELANEAAADG